MKNFFAISLFICLEAFLNGTALSQVNKIADIQAADTTYFIPPLGELIDSATKNNAMFRYYELGAEAKKYGLATEKMSWSRNIGLQADVRYGTFDNFSTNTAEGQSPALYATSTTQTNYGIGAYVKLPVSDFLSRKNKIMLARTEVKQAETMAEVQRDQIRQMVIKQYNDLLLKRTVLMIKARSLESSRTNMILAEKEFKTGVITLGTYSGLSETLYNSEINFEQAKVDFKTEYMLLEELAGFKFSSKESNR